MTKKYKEIIRSAIEDISPNSVSEKQDRGETIYSTFIENKMGTLTRQLKVFLNDENCDIRLRAYIDTGIPEMKRNKIFEMMNDLHMDYRFVKKKKDMIFMNLFLWSLEKKMLLISIF